MFARLATTGSDYAKCKRAYSIEKRYEYPTIMIEQEDHGNLIAYLTTTTESGYIVAGPIWIEPSMSGPGKVRIFMRMLDAYQLVLAKNGVDRFLFWVDGTDTRYIDQLRRGLGIDPYEIDEAGRLWFKIQFGEDQLLKEQEDERQQYNGTGASN